MRCKGQTMVSDPFNLPQNQNGYTRAKKCNGKIRWEVIMSCYSFLLMLFSHFFSLSRDGQTQIIDKYNLIIIAFLVAIEILNQITFFYARINRKRAIIIKCLAFWLIFTAGIAVYVFLTSRLQRIDHWNWHEDIICLVLYLVLSWVFPIYSLCPDIRYIFLYGKFNNDEAG